MKNKLQITTFIIIIGCIVASCVGVGNTGNAGRGAGLSIAEAVERAVTDISRKLPKGTRIAVVSFSSETVQVSNYIMEELGFDLLKRGLIVADRTNLEAVRKELDFQLSGEVDDKTAQSIGKFLGVEYVVTGQFVFTGDSYRFRVNTERVEKAERVVASNLIVRNDSNTKKLVDSLNKTKIQSHSAGY